MVKYRGNHENAEEKEFIPSEEEGRNLRKLPTFSVKGKQDPVCDPGRGEGRSHGMVVSLHGVFRTSVWPEQEGGQGVEPVRPTKPSAVGLRRVCAEQGELFLSILSRKRESG